ncbi:unnamed protein product, partial [Rotaria sp. Silwood1]
SFPDGHNFDKEEFSTIPENTVLTVNIRTGQIINQWGNNTCGIDNVETNRNDHGKVNAIIGHPLMKTAYAINYHPNKPDRFYAVSGRNDQN